MNLFVNNLFFQNFLFIIFNAEGQLCIMHYELCIIDKLPGPYIQGL